MGNQRRHRSRVENALRLQRQSRKFQGLLVKLSLEEVVKLMPPKVRPRIYSMQSVYCEEKGGLALLECPRSETGTALLVWNRARSAASSVTMVIRIDRCHEVLVELFAPEPNNLPLGMLSELIDACRVHKITKICAMGGVEYARGFIPEVKEAFANAGISFAGSREFFMGQSNRLSAACNIYP